MIADAVVIGGGPAGSAVARVLASWGHRVALVARAQDPSRGMAESIPPSTRRLLAEVGVLQAVDAANFYRSSGNTVWWASDTPRVERFSGIDGYQVFRPDFDRVLLACAQAAGADVRVGRVRGVSMTDAGARVEYEEEGCARAVDARFAVDCSGRAGILGRALRQPQPGHRTYALAGVWRRAEGWDLPDSTHTTVETVDDGWIWSVPISREVRHVAAMVDASSPALADSAPLDVRYRRQVRRSVAVGPLLDGAALGRVFACDASLYKSARYAGSSFLLAGDAGSSIDPLSSYGVKKALASAWVAAVAVHTALVDHDRCTVAFEFFNERERQVYDDYLRRSREFARTAHAAYGHPFWAARAAVDVAEPESAPDVRAAFERLKQSPPAGFSRAREVRVVPRPVIRGHEIRLEESFDGVRFHEHVDLVALADVACACRTVPDVYETYCRAHSGAPLPNVMSGLALLVAKGILTLRG